VDNSLSCHSCHNISEGGDDGRRFSVGINGAIGPINAPTVLNSGLNIAQFWDGRASTLEEQVDGPVTHPNEMGSTWDDVQRKLSDDPEMVAAFADVLDGHLTPQNIQTAIAAYERTLQTPNSPFDQWLFGNDDALTETELRGYSRFKELGCVSCHQGRNVGGNMYQTFGVMGDYFEGRSNLTDADLGRFAVTGNELDRHSFRVPSLRNVELTAPYFHDGSVDSLPDAVRVMAIYQLGRPLSDGDVDDIAAFLRTLTGELPSTAEYQ
jgi:cytochrome c peroxidase